VDFSINLNDSLRAPHMHHVSSIDAAVAASRLGCYYSKLDIKDCFLSFAIRSGDERSWLLLRGEILSIQEATTGFEYRTGIVRVDVVGRVMAAHSSWRYPRSVL
jgi:hypothetical protein